MSIAYRIIENAQALASQVIELDGDETCTVEEFLAQYGAEVPNLPVLRAEIFNACIFWNELDLDREVGTHEEYLAAELLNSYFSSPRDCRQQRGEDTLYMIQEVSLHFFRDDMLSHEDRARFLKLYETAHNVQARRAGDLILVDLENLTVVIGSWSPVHQKCQFPKSLLSL